MPCWCPAHATDGCCLPYRGWASLFWALLTRRRRTCPTSLWPSLPRWTLFCQKPPSTWLLRQRGATCAACGPVCAHLSGRRATRRAVPVAIRSEEHTSELQSRENLVCRLLL